MEKFKKLSRDEMKKITGGTPLCSCDEYTLCQCNGGPIVCVPIPAHNGCTSPGRATGATCMDWCGSPGVVLPTYCWIDAQCTVKA
ncbi:MAG: hypothetical protein JWP94_95 [Mucilaginibacter sp.]|nr:hypothetical protein [Mucilaginibacter sp.]